jgi:hypothetical protein
MEIVQKYVLKKRRSGYSGIYRPKIGSAAFGIYRQRLKEDKEGMRQLYRGRDYKKSERRIEATKTRNSSYVRDKGSDKFYTAHPIPSGKMEEDIKKICGEEGEDVRGIRIRVAERGDKN